MEYCVTVLEFAFFGSLTIFGIGAFLFLLTAINEINENLKSIDEHAQSKEEHSKLFKKLSGIIRGHSVVQELSEHRIFISSIDFETIKC